MAIPMRSPRPSPRLRDPVGIPSGIPQPIMRRAEPGRVLPGSGVRAPSLDQHLQAQFPQSRTGQMAHSYFTDRPVTKFMNERGFGPVTEYVDSHAPSAVNSPINYLGGLLGAITKSAGPAAVELAADLLKGRSFSFVDYDIEITAKKRKDMGSGAYRPTGPASEYAGVRSRSFRQALDEADR